MANAFVSVAIAVAIVSGPAFAQQGGDVLPPIPASMMEMQGRLNRVDPARSTVWINGKPYKVTANTMAFVGSDRAEDLREMAIGSPVGFMDDGNGNLLTLWVEQRAAKGGARK